MEADTAVLGLRQWIDYEALVPIKYPTKQHSEENPQQPTRMVFKLYLLGISLDLGNKDFELMLHTSNHLALVAVSLLIGYI